MQEKKVLEGFNIYIYLFNLLKSHAPRYKQMTKLQKMRLSQTVVFYGAKKASYDKKYCSLTPKKKQAPHYSGACNSFLAWLIKAP